MTTSVRRVESFTVVVPAFNEGATLRTNIEAIRAYLSEAAGNSAWTILIVDDASTDHTREISADLSREDARIRTIRRSSNGGVDAAIRSGIEGVQTEAVVVLDADLSYQPPIIGALLEVLNREEAEVTVASAYAPGGEVRDVPGGRAFLSRWANRFLAYAAHERVHTFTCIVRAYRTAALRVLLEHCPRGDTTYQLLFEALRVGMRVEEIPATLQWTPGRRSSMKPSAIVGRTWNVMGAAIHKRPSLALALPGLIPGLLPLAIFLAVLFHARPVVVGIVASAMFAIQTASLVVFGFHSTNFAIGLLGRRSHERHALRNIT